LKLAADGLKGLNMRPLRALKKGVRAIVREAGFELVPAQRLNMAATRRSLIMRYHGIQTVLDVGANIGQYGAELCENGFRGRIISFEPTHDAFKALSQRAATHPNWIVFNFAAGAEDGVSEINVASNSGESSSLMPMLESHTRYAPEIRYVATEHVSVKTLDAAVADIVARDEILMLKMDVQGFEHFVLRGATAILPQVRVIECELSFVSLYEGQMLFPQMLALLDSMDFLPVGFNPVFSDPVSGHCPQVDGVFARAG
jgi:FkbM family methyltransferase